MNGVVDGSLNQLNVATHRHIRRSPVLIDGIFQADPLMAMIKKSCVAPYPGGRVHAFNITFDVLLTSAYEAGDDFDLTDQKIDDQAQMFRRLLEGNVTLTMEEIEVDNVGDAAVYKNVDSKLRNIYNAVGSDIAIMLYLKNQTTYYGKMLAGLAEAINDGTNASWDGQTYASYGGLTRANYNGALTPYWATASGNPVEYDDLTDLLEETSWGDGELEPNVLMTSPKGYSSIKKRFQVQQRLNESTPVIGFKGYSVENATVMKSRYCPGQDIATTTKKSNRVAMKFIRATTKNKVTTYPSVSNETMFALNVRKPNMHLLVSTSKRYQFGFTGWKVTAHNTKVSGQVLWAGLFTVDNPSFHGQLVNFS